MIILCSCCNQCHLLFLSRWSQLVVLEPFLPICLITDQALHQKLQLIITQKKQKVLILLGEGEQIGKDDEAYFPCLSADIYI